MKPTTLKISLALSALTLAVLSLAYLDNSDSTNTTSAALDANKTFASIEFTDTAAPSTAAQMATTYTESSAIVTYTDGTKDTFPLSYTKLFGVNDKVGTNPYPAGTLYNEAMQPILDPNGLPAVAETPDANSLLNIDGQIYLISHLEYDWREVLADGSESTARLARKPMSMILTKMAQDPKRGALTAVDQAPIDFSNVDGLWIPCFGSQTPWNTHLGSEEDYDLQYNPLATSYTVTQSGLDQLDNLYFTSSSTPVANPYHYGYMPEVTVNANGTPSVVKHYSMGRGTWEMSKVMPDGKTAYHGDDGSNVASIMYVADKAGDLSAGTLYAAKVTEQTGSYSANIKWVKLGQATDAQVKTLADTHSFGDIFNNEAANPDGTCPTLTRVRAGSTTDECLSVKTGKEQAAAFLETRRYAALLGATTEFNKMEGIAVNNKDKHLYMAISYLDGGMKDNGLPANMEHLKMAKISAGATLTLPMAAGQDDINGNLIASDYVVTNFYIEDNLRGRDITPDALGNIADPSYIANTDNVFFSEKMRTLFIGEDSGTHVNNFVWAYNVDTKKLSRILTNVAGAEATGLQAVENMNGHAYIMSNSQHHGEYISTMNADLAAAVDAIGVQKVNAGNFGYIGGIPAIK
ncbi:PhoX family protein [Thiomicrorhabdus aquaedulcis]|uniref:PhoX family protein n=1 Tax=Thiomicrorhabdus aquaedulcis TaxID=2211106 RepID=UPI000FDC5B5A|nr:alkaline phosphatase PhoX [Thiomicrorhabdus aquaedulcis]